MNKTISIALAGFSFIVEEQAYIKLSDYLQALRNSLSEEEREEVMYDIEIRVAEIFKENLDKREVVTYDDVEKVIALIGTPEIIEEQEDTYYSEKMKESKNNQSYQSNERKQFFRDTERSKIAGVCAGLAHYVGMDVTIMRLIWVIALFVGLFFPVVILYILLWAVTPKAESVSDILKMKGKPIDFENIKEESIRFASESSQKVGEFYEKNKPMIMKTGGNFLNIARKLVGVIAILLVFALIIAGGFMIVGLLGDYHFVNEMKFELGELQNVVIGIALLTIFIFIVLFSSVAIKCFSPNTKMKYVGFLLGILFAILGVTAGYIGVEKARQEAMYVGNSQEEENVNIVANENVLELDIKKVNIPQNFVAYGRNIFTDEKRVFERDRPDVEIIQSNTVQAPYLIIKKKADGYNFPIRMNIPIEVSNGKVLFPNYIGYSYDERQRDFDVSYELVVPMGVRVVDLSKGGLGIDRADVFDDEWDRGLDETLDNIFDDDFPLKKDGNIKIETNTDTITIRRQ